MVSQILNSYTGECQVRIRPFENDLVSAHTGEGTGSSEKGLYIEIDVTDTVTNPLFWKIYSGK